VTHWSFVMDDIVDDDGGIDVDLVG